MKKTCFALVALLTLALSGCAVNSKTQTYRPANYAGTAWRISGTLDQIAGTVTTRINGQEVSVTEFGPLGGFSQTANSVGEYDGRQIATECEKVRGGAVCQVFVDNELAATI